MSPEQEQLLERRRRSFDQFVSEMRSVLDNLSRAIWPDEPDLLMRDPLAALPAMEKLFADENLDEIPENELNLIRIEITFYFARLLMQRVGGEWRIVEAPESPLFARYVVSGFSRNASPDAVIEPAGVADRFVKSAVPRSLIATIDAAEAYLRTTLSR